MNAPHTCTKDDPYIEGTHDRCIHPSAIEGEQEDGWPSGDIVRWHCPICGTRWKEELPQ